MKHLFLSIAMGAFLGGGILWYQETAHLCPVPIAYRIGTIDDRFGVTPEAVQAMALQAEAVWESGLNEELFVYDEQSDFTLNFIYDERQQQARTQEEWQARLDTIEAKNAAQVDTLTRLNSQYTADITEFEERRTRYESRLTAYNNEVAKYNATGGAPGATYERLRVEAEALNTELRRLGELEDQLREMSESLNAKSAAVNQDIEAYNEEVSHYNELFGAVEIFTQGDYKRDRINVYKFTSPEELTTVLVHEFGHALGIGHVEDESAIMYHLMTERDSLLLTSADREAFLTVCEDVSSVAAEIRRIIRSIVL